MRLWIRLTGVSGAAVNVLLEALAKAQQRVADLYRRPRDMHFREAALAATDIDPGALQQTLAQFEPIWDVLPTPEKNSCSGSSSRP